MKTKSKSTKKLVPQINTLQKHKFQFLLTPLNQSCYFSEASSLDCCPHYDKKTKKYLNIWPQINLDKKYYTPFFALQADRDNLSKKQSDYKETHEARIKNALQSKNQILVPHPGKLRHNCFVCKSHYNDYRTHIGSKAHKQKLRNGRNEIFIQQLVTKVSLQNVQTNKECVKTIGYEPKQTKKQKKEQKLRQKQQMALEQIQIYMVQDLKHKQATQASIEKNQENQTLQNCEESRSQQFRVSNYLL